MAFLKQSTTATLRIGPFLDATTGVDEETGLSLAATDIQISKNNGAFANKNDATAPTHDSNGWYTCTLDATDTNTVGRLLVKSDDSTTHLPVWHEFYIVEEVIFDSLFTASSAAFDASQRVDVGSWLGTAVTTSATSTKPEVDVNSISDDATAANNLELDYDGTGYAKANSTMGTVTTLTGHTVQTGDNFARLGAPAGASVSADVAAIQTDTDAIETDTQDIQSRLPSSLVSGRMDSDVSNIQSGAIDADAIATDAIGAAELAADAVAEIIDGVWDEAVAGHVGAGSFGATDAAILADTNELQGDWVDGGRLDLILDARASQTTADAIETDTQDIQSRLPAALVGGAMDSDVSTIQSNVITAASIATDAIDATAIAADVDTYQAKVWLIDDNTGTTDRYFTVWFKNGEPVTTGITSPTIQVIKVVDGTDLVASTAMTEVASLGMYHHDEATNRIIDGQAYFVKVEATIASSTRTWFQTVGRDS